MNFANRHEVEEYLAGQVAGGAIVEIGCGFGHGLAALNRGNIHKLPLFGVDPYIEYNDPLGGKYGPDTKQAMLENTAGVAFSHIEQPALKVGREWRGQIGLLWVDLSMPYDALWPIVQAWQWHIIPGGYLAITGLSYNELGTRRIMKEMLGTGRFERVLPEQDLVAVLKKPYTETPPRAAFYIAANSPAYIAEAEHSAESVKRHLKVDTWLFTSSDERPKVFDEVVKLPPPRFSRWYRNQVDYFNRAITGELASYNQLLYLDTDTYICRDCSGVWRIIDNYDMAMGHSASRGGTSTAVNCPAEFATLGIGANFFNNTPKVQGFFADWQRQFEEYYDTYGETDEAPLRDLLFLNKHGISYFVLAPEEHCRFGFGVWLSGTASILHGRVDKPLAEIEKEVNAQTTMRLYRYGDGMLWYHRRA